MHALISCSPYGLHKKFCQKSIPETLAPVVGRLRLSTPLLSNIYIDRYFLIVYTCISIFG